MNRSELDHEEKLRLRLVTYATTDEGLAKRLSDAFHVLTGGCSTSRASDKLYMVSAHATDRVSREVLKRIADSIIREDDVALLA